MYEYYVYILLCSDGSYYTGITNELSRRVAEHEAGKNKTSYTFKRRPVELVYAADFTDVEDAISWEKTVKGWSRQKKEALIRGEYEKLPELAKRYTRYMAKGNCHAEGPEGSSRSTDNC